MVFGGYLMYIYSHLAIENTANQYAQKPMYFCQYYTEPSRRSMQFNGITPNLPLCVGIHASFFQMPKFSPGLNFEV